MKLCASERRAAFIYSHAFLFLSTEILPAEANMGPQATKSFDISDLWTGTVNTAGWREDRDAGWSIETEFASIVFHLSAELLIKNLLPAIRVGLLNVSWVDRGLDLEKEEEGWRGDNAIEIVRIWLIPNAKGKMVYVLVDGENVRKKKKSLSSKACTGYYLTK